jgi:hypothetical protein
MSFSRISISLALGLSLNTGLASEPLEHISSVYSQEQPLVIAFKQDSRRRGVEGECDIPDAISDDEDGKLWIMNLAQACKIESFCYRAQEEVKFWLPKIERSGRMTLILKTPRSKTQKRQTEKLRWSSQKKTLPWPELMPIQSGTKYRMLLKTRQGVEFDRFITLHEMPAELETTTEQWMREQGCTQQADQLIPEENAEQEAEEAEEAQESMDG